MRRVLIVRHGDNFTSEQRPRRIGAAVDIPLVENGRNQAIRLGQHFNTRGMKFDLVLASPLRRTTETATLLLTCMPASSCAIEPADWLTEIDHGPDEGKLEGEVVARIGRETLDRWDREACAPPGWKVDPDRRIADWRRFIAEQAMRGDGAALVVTSSGIARFALLAFAGARPSSFKLRTGAYAEIALGKFDRHLISWDFRPR